VTTLAVVRDLDDLEQRVFSLPMGLVLAMMGELSLQRTEEAFNHGIVITPRSLALEFVIS
jgi:hypothetical protein